MAPSSLISTRVTSERTQALTSSLLPLRLRLYPVFSLPLLLLLLFTILTPAVQAYTPLSDTSLARLLPPSSHLHTDTTLNFNPSSSALLSPILIPRVPGTPGSDKVQRHFVDFFARELPGWTLEWQNSTSKTPATGELEVEFRNLIFRRDPPWLMAGGRGDGEGGEGGETDGEGKGKGKGKKKFVKRLTLAAHYDSLYRPEGFIGAIDSAAPCAMLMAVARNVDRALAERWESIKKKKKLAGEDDNDGLDDSDDELEDGEESEQGVQIVFLDGEEAWVKWTDTDSLYGSRSLAEEWEGKKLDEGVSTQTKPKTELDAISLFVLLDLLGAPDPQVPSFFRKTHWAYQHLAAAEAKLRKMGLLESKPARPFLQEGKKKANTFTGGYVLDDHVPFLKRGVPVLHVIPLPFPEVWHTMEDDGEHLDVPTVGDWAKIVSVFVAEWMDVEGYVPEQLEPTDAEAGERQTGEGNEWRGKEEL